MAKKNNNFFIQMKSQFGENFLNFIDSRSLQIKSLQIFRQMARGQVDVAENGKYFLDERLMQASLIAIEGKIRFHAISGDGVEALQEKLRAKGTPADANIISVGEYHKRSFEGYTLIRNTLLIINQTRDLSVLLTLVSNLSKYRDYI